MSAGNTVSGHLANLGRFAVCASTGHFGMALFPAIGIGAGLVSDVLDKGHPLTKAAVGVLSSVCGNLTTDSAQHLANALRRRSNHDLERVALAALRAALEHCLHEIGFSREDGGQAEREEMRSIFNMWFKRIDRGLSSEGELDALVGAQFPIDPAQMRAGDDTQYWTLLSDSLLRWIGEQERFEAGILQVSLDHHGRRLPRRLESYLAEHLPEFTRKAVTRVLREPEHAKGWIAWQQRVLEEIANQTGRQDTVLAEQLSEVASRVGDFQPILLVTLNEMGFKLDEIGHDVKEVRTGIERVEEGVGDLRRGVSSIKEDIGRIAADTRSRRPIDPFETVPPFPRDAARNPQLLSYLRKLILTANPGCNIISIIGKGSISETNLAIELGEDHQVRARFPDGIVWLPIGSDPSGLPDRCVRILADAFNKDYARFNRDTWSSRFSASIRDKAFLIIFNGVSKLASIEEFANNVNGRSMVVFTTRDRKIASSFDALEFDPEDIQRRVEQMRGGAYPYVYGEFRIDDGPIFFGREHNTDEILDQIEGDLSLRMYVLQGPSGTGKSSLLQAGLLYALAAGEKKRRLRNKRWAYCLLKPFDSDIPLFRLMAQCLPGNHGRFEDRGRIGNALFEASSKGSGEAKSAIQRYLLDPLNPGYNLILAVNQLEELWTKIPKEMVDPFLSFLAAAAEHQRILILATVRDDYSAEFKNASQIAPLFQQRIASEYPLGRPSQKEIRDVIVKPARSVEPPITFSDEAGLVEAISRDAYPLGSAALPLISLMLQTLRQPDRNQDPTCHFTIEMYRELGGLEGIGRTLAQQAEIPPNPDLLNSFFRRLVEIKNHGGQRKPVLREVRRDELVASAVGDSSAAMDLVERLVSSRLFFEHDGLVRIGYESLLEHWEELKKWSERNAWDQAIIDEQRQDALLWQRRGRRPEYLKTRSRRLDEVDELLTRNRLSGSREDTILHEYLRECRVRSLRDELVQCVKGGEVTNAFARIKQLRKMKMPLLALEERGTESNQLKQAFWAAITGEHRPYDDAQRKFTGESIFKGEEGSWQMVRTTSGGLTAISWAAVAGHFELVKELLAMGDKSWKKLLDNDNTSIGCAAVGGNLEAISPLVEAAEKAGMDPLRPSRDGGGPLTWAIQENHNDVVEYLLARGGSLEFKADGEFDALTEAARGNNLTILRRLLVDLKWNPDKKTEKNGRTALHFACVTDRSDEADAARALIHDYDADVHARDGAGETPLHIACSSGKVSAIALLIESSREKGEIEKLLNARTNNGWTPLHAASFSDKPRAVELLVAAGANLNAVDEYGDPPLVNAVSKGHYRVVQLLLDAGAATNIFGRKRWPPLSYAADDGDLEMVELLLRAKDLDRNILVEPGWTPLMVAAERGHDEVVKVLLQRGADPCYQNTQGQTVVSIASTHRHQTVIDVLKEWGKNNPTLAVMVNAEEIKRKEAESRLRQMLEKWGTENAGASEDSTDE